ncbi:hypothetical protein ACFPH6_00440 [Streptomyces xiangluensis]|uniref:Uncharacterized protein n=1 Tax=Streptomyces xiangluensis TaxID=2665720 RepID=A0ABV8YCQ2_9ACTN
MLALLAILYDAGRLRRRTAATALATAAVGYAAVLGAITATAYAGRAPHTPTVVMSALLMTGALALAMTAALAVTHMQDPPVPSDSTDPNSFVMKQS